MKAAVSYGASLATYLFEAGHQVSIINPVLIKAYANSRLSRYPCMGVTISSVGEENELSSSRSNEPPFSSKGECIFDTLPLIISYVFRSLIFPKSLTRCVKLNVTAF